MRTIDGSELNLEFLTVPLICEPMTGQSMSLAVTRFLYLKDIELADMDCHGANLEVNILIGSDHYWKVVSGPEGGPNAIETRFGWVLSGPIGGLACSNTVATFVSSHALTVMNELPSSYDSLDALLRHFWI